MVFYGEKRFKVKVITLKLMFFNIYGVLNASDKVVPGFGNFVVWLWKVLEILKEFVRTL